MRKRSKRKYLAFAIGSVALLLVGAVWLLFGRGDTQTYATFEVRQGPLDIKVLEGGNVEALEAQEIKSRVKGWEGVKILYIVDEGYFVTEDDIKNKKKLVELDATSLREKLTTSEIQFKSTQASLAEAQQGYDIQLNQSESDIYSAEVEVTLAKYAMEKFLGAKVTEIVLGIIADAEATDLKAEAAVPPRDDQIRADLRETMAAHALGPPETGEGPPSAEAAPIVEAPTEGFVPMTLEAIRHTHPKIEFAKYADPELLGDGEANQQLRKFEDEVLVAEKELAQASTHLDGQRRLFDRDFVTQKELDRAQLDVDKQQVSVDGARIAKNVFIEYEFPKQGEKLMSDYVLAKRKLQRSEKQAISEMAKAQAKLLSAEAQFNIEKTRIEEYRQQIGVSTMYAEKSGLVVYGGNGREYWNEEPIKAGANVREQQAIITIPDMTTMAANVKIHESDIKKIQKEQRAFVRADAMPDLRLEGKVISVAVLPDSENRWMNPDLKVYETKISIDGVHDWLKPGMSAEVEVFVDRVEDAIYIPIQSVVPQGKEQVCFVLNGGGEPERRVIETGQTTVEWITVTSGLKKGELVLIRPPAGSRQDETGVEADDAQGLEENPLPDQEGAAPQVIADKDDAAAPSSPDAD